MCSLPRKTKAISTTTLYQAKCNPNRCKNLQSLTALVICACSHRGSGMPNSRLEFLLHMEKMEPTYYMIKEYLVIREGKETCRLQRKFPHEYKYLFEEEWSSAIGQTLPRGDFFVTFYDNNTSPFLTGSLNIICAEYWRRLINI